MRVWVLATILGCILVVSPLWTTTVQAQEVERAGFGFGSVRRAGDRAADDQGRRDWPRITDGDPGTQVHVSFDPRNVDVVLMTGRNHGLEPLLSNAKAIAHGLDRPEADFITFEGTKVVVVDVELNDYLRHPARGQTSVELDLTRLAAALDASTLPRPIVLLIDPDGADEAVLTAAGSSRPLKQPTFFGLAEVKSGTRVRFEATLSWYAPVVGWGLAALLLGGVLLAMAMPWRVARHRARQRALAADAIAEAPDPAEVQKQYDEQRPIWQSFALFPTVLLGFAIFGNPQKVLEEAFYTVPFLGDRTMLFLPVAMAVGVGGSFLLCTLVERARVRQGAAMMPEPADPDAPPVWTQRWWSWVMCVPMAAMMLMPLLLFSGLPRTRWLLAIPIGAGVLMFGGLAVGGWLSARAVRRTLQAGDPWHDTVQDLARAAKVQVRRVVRVQSTEANAFVTLFGTVGLTSALLRKLEPEEVRAVIAHELGHLRGGHARRNFTLRLVGTLAVLFLWWGLGELFKGRISDSGLAMMRSPIFPICLLPFLMNLILGRGGRRREEEADRFAVAVTGDPELVIRALTKLHTLSATPHALKKSDEAISTHPSLAHRIEAIRKSAASGIQE